MKKIAITIFFLIAPQIIYTKEEDQFPHVQEGNLALPTSQQPSPLFSFGQNIVDKNDFQFIPTLDIINGFCQNFNEIALSFLYGINNNFSIYVNIPFAAKFKKKNTSSSGIEDCTIQLEYAVYNNPQQTYSDQITVVGNFSIPTGSKKKRPITGTETTNFFVGATASHMAIKWYYYASTGAQFFTKNNGDKLGNQFYYQFGIGRNIPTSNRWIVTPILEFNGVYNKKNRLNRCIDNNSGGSFILLGPSLWIANKTWIIEPGISFFPLQRLNGEQNKNKYFASISFRYKFNS